MKRLRERIRENNAAFTTAYEATDLHTLIVIGVTTLVGMAAWIGLDALFYSSLWLGERLGDALHDCLVLNPVIPYGYECSYRGEWTYALASIGPAIGAILALYLLARWKGQTFIRTIAGMIVHLSTQIETALEEAKERRAAEEAG